MYVSMCICIYVYMYVGMYVCMRVHIHFLTIPCDSNPAIFAAFKFVTTITFLPGQKFSNVKCARRPCSHTHK